VQDHAALQELKECRNAGMQECRNAGMQECRNAGMQEPHNTRKKKKLTCRSAGNQEGLSDSHLQRLNNNHTGSTL